MTRSETFNAQQIGLLLTVLPAMGCGETIRNDSDPATNSDAVSSGGASTAATTGTATSSTTGSASAATTNATAATVGSGTSGNQRPSSTDAPRFAGTWALFTFEDPVVVTLRASGDSIEGTGCCTPSALSPPICCGPVSGEARGAHLSFVLTLEDLDFVYAFNVFAAEDGSRMAGYFGDETLDTGADSTQGFPIAWLRLGPGDNWLPLNQELMSEEFPGRVAFQLAAGSAEGDGFVAGESYEVGYNIDNAVYGDFGAFWVTEISVRPDDGAIMLGPVPASAPHLPVSVVLRRDGLEIVAATVTMPSGSTYLFDAVSAG